MSEVYLSQTLNIRFLSVISLKINMWKVELGSCLQGNKNTVSKKKNKEVKKIQLIEVERRCTLARGA